MNDVPVLDKEMSTTGKNLSDSIVEKYAFVFQSCDVNMKLLVENKVSHYPASDVLLKKSSFPVSESGDWMDRGIGCFSGKTWRLPGLGWKGCR